MYIVFLEALSENIEATIGVSVCFERLDLHFVRTKSTRTIHTPQTHAGPPESSLTLHNSCTQTRPERTLDTMIQVAQMYYFSNTVAQMHSCSCCYTQVVHRLVLTVWENVPSFSNPKLLIHNPDYKDYKRLHTCPHELNIHTDVHEHLLRMHTPAFWNTGCAGK